MVKKGRFIVIEGGDGSGKTTQADLLISYLKNHRIPSAYISFPRYKDSIWGAMVRRYLDGDFGKIGDVDPYLVSMLYAGDRFSASGQIREWLESGKTIVCNRYVGSNIGHMSAKFKSTLEKRKYSAWLEKLEYEENGIPKEDVVVLLQVEPAVSRRLMKERKMDIHEADLKYQEEVYKAYENTAKSKKNWLRINCARNGQLLAPEVIHQMVVKQLSTKRII